MALTIYSLWAAALVSFVVLKIVQSYITTYRLSKISTVGSSSIFWSYLDAFKFMRYGIDILQEGYEKYPGSTFKIARVNRWHVFVSGHQLIEDIRRAPEDQLSITRAASEGLQFKYTFGEIFNYSFYHIDVVRGPLTRNIGAKFSEIRDEIVASFEDEVPLTQEWTRVKCIKTIQRVVSRTSNRLFVGLPLCRNEEFRNLNIDFTVDVFVTAQLLNVLPNFIRPIVARITSRISRKIDQAVRLLTPIITERLQKDEKYGPDWQGRPNDLLSWLLDVAPPEGKNVHDLTMRILSVNFAAIHTSSLTFTHALYFLAAYQEYVKPLREEIETLIEENGWNNATVGKMRKLDSFLKEAQRLLGISGVGITRVAVNDFTFSDGTTIPAGTFVSIPSHAIHCDRTIYPDAHEFKGFRFAEMHDASQTESVKHHMVTPNHDYLLFGCGRHACPGRFFAVNELKVMMAHVLLTYDVKFEDDRRSPPAPMQVGGSIIPDSKARVVFRARKSS